jgi:hypothetical protein
MGVKKETKLFGPNRSRSAAQIPAKTSGHSFTGKQLAESYDRAAKIRRADQEEKPDERRDA